MSFNILVAIVMLNVVATITLWRTARRYDIYLNQVRIGTLELSAAFNHASLDQRDVIANISVGWARLLDISTIRDLLGVIALHICDPRSTSEDFDRRGRRSRVVSQTRFGNCSTSPDTTDHSPDYGELNLRLVGAAEFYFDRRNSASFTEQKRQRLRST